MKQLQHLSFSSINLHRNCNKSWYVNYVLGERTPSGDAANRGSQFDQLIGHRVAKTPLVECDMLHDAKTGQPIPLIDRVEEAAEIYAANGGWDRADEAQREIRLTPNQWDVFRSLYDVDWTLHLPIIGYIDLFRRDATGLRVELCDIKTSERAEYRPDWSLQCALYSLVERAAKFEVHLVTFTKQIKLLKYSYRPTDKTYAWAMNMIGAEAERIKRTASERIVDKIPASAGFWCSWCPRSTDCEAAVVAKLNAEGNG